MPDRVKKPVLPAPEDLARLFPQLEILGMIGHGGMGAVYKARQKQLDRVVALKILPPSARTGPAFEDRFVREARALAKLNHPGVVTLYEFGQSGGLFFFLMEFVDGINLRQLIEGGRLSAHEALAIVPQICDALQYAHDQGIVHRDIKPENLLMDRQGRIKVADFGLAKLMNSSDEPVSIDRANGSPVLSGAGKVMGTPQYMAPEQREHPTEVDHRADIYSLGVVFYQMLTGELPGKNGNSPAARLRGLQIDVRLDEVVLRAMEREPQRRYQQASALKTQLETIAAAPLDPSIAAPSSTEQTPVQASKRPPNRARIVRWTARGLGTLVILMALPFVVAQGLPPIASQPAGVQMTFVGGFLLLAGFLVGWRRDGSAALLIAAGWTTINISEGIAGLSPLHLVLPIAAFYAYCWWTQHGRKTAALFFSSAVFALALALGRLFCPVNVFVQATVADAGNGKAIAGAQIVLPEKSSASANFPAIHNADTNGICLINLGWYDSRIQIQVSAPGYSMLETNLGPWETGRRRISRNYRLVQSLAPANTAASQIPPVVVRTYPQSGSSGVDPGIGEIKVTFSQQMSADNPVCSQAMGGRVPDMAGPSLLASDGCTLVLPVRLQPGTVYAAWINHEKSLSFRSRNGFPAVPYLLIFETKK
jgi:predicted Ser/Thr protein kinase